MKKKLSLAIFLLATGIVLAVSAFRYQAPQSEANYLTEHRWKFHSVASANPSTVSYITTLYQESEYAFASGKTYSGTFFGKPLSGSWNIDKDRLILNKGTAAEESYLIAELTTNSLTLKATEKGETVMIRYQ